MEISTFQYTFLLLVYIFTACFAKSISDHRSYDIINGHPINITDAPFFAIFRPKGETWHCGASIVSEQFLVTAAHCVNTTIEYEVVVGTDKIQPGNGEEYEVESKFRHPNYNGSNFDYDIAVIKLKKKLHFNEKVKIIKMADYTNQVKKGDIVQTLGFGMTKFISNYSDILRGVDMEYVDHEECAKMYSVYGWSINERMTCAGSSVLGPLHADSGGALVFRDLLIGAVSWGNPGGNPPTPAVFANIPSMRDFIDKTIKENIKK